MTNGLGWDRKLYRCLFQDVGSAFLSVVWRCFTRVQTINDPKNRYANDRFTYSPNCLCRLHFNTRLLLMVDHGTLWLICIQEEIIWSRWRRSWPDGTVTEGCWNAHSGVKSRLVSLQSTLSSFPSSTRPPSLSSSSPSSLSFAPVFPPFLPLFTEGSSCVSVDLRSAPVSVFCSDNCASKNTHPGGPPIPDTLTLGQRVNPVAPYITRSCRGSGASLEASEKWGTCRSTSADTFSTRRQMFPTHRGQKVMFLLNVVILTHLENQQNQTEIELWHFEPNTYSTSKKYIHNGGKKHFCAQIEKMQNEDNIQSVTYDGWKYV